MAESNVINLNELDSMYAARDDEGAKTWLLWVSSCIERARDNENHCIKFFYDHWEPLANNNMKMRARAMLSLVGTSYRKQVNWLASGDGEWTGWHGWWEMHGHEDARQIKAWFRYDGGRHLPLLEHVFKPQHAGTLVMPLVALKAIKWEGGKRHTIYLHTAVLSCPAEPERILPALQDVYRFIIEDGEDEPQRILPALQDGEVEPERILPAPQDGESHDGIAVLEPQKESSESMSTASGCTAAASSSVSTQ